jgi:molybdopterin/thiamine biosynthesis adenylyltransferase
MDLIKHLELFNPDKLRGKQIAVIGAGATGSMTVLQLAKLGVENIHVYDFDTIEPHNIPNQLLYGVNDIGYFKADILADKVNGLVGKHVVMPYKKKVESRKLYQEVVFFCVDTMASRIEIFNKGIYLNGITELVIDMRMNARTALVFALDPRTKGAVDSYRAELYTDEEVEPLKGNCGVVLSVGPTAALTSSLAIWQFIELINKPSENLECGCFSITQNAAWELQHYTVGHRKID